MKKYIFPFLFLISTNCFSEVVMYPDFGLNVDVTESIRFIESRSSGSTSCGVLVELEPTTSPVTVYAYAQAFKIETGTHTIPLTHISYRIQLPGSSEFSHSSFLPDSYIPIFKSSVPLASVTNFTFHINLEIPQYQRPGVYRSRLHMKTENEN